MRVAKTIKEFIAIKNQLIKGRATPSVGFVPTMGYLHQGLI